MGLYVKTFRQPPFRTYLAKLQIILGRHENINVVIPRNKTSVARRAQERTVCEPPTKTMLITNTHKFLQNIQLKKLELAQLYTMLFL